MKPTESAGRSYTTPAGYYLRLCPPSDYESLTKQFNKEQIDKGISQRQEGEMDTQAYLETNSYPPKACQSTMSEFYNPAMRKPQPIIATDASSGNTSFDTALISAAVKIISLVCV